jgi:hypothetical protein
MQNPEGTDNGILRAELCGEMNDPDRFAMIQENIRAVFWFQISEQGTERTARKSDDSEYSG